MLVATIISSGHWTPDGTMESQSLQQDCAKRFARESCLRHGSKILFKQLNLRLSVNGSNEERRQQRMDENHRGHRVFSRRHTAFLGRFPGVMSDGDELPEFTPGYADAFIRVDASGCPASGGGGRTS